MQVSRLKVGIAGASIGGLSVANVLLRAGADVTVLERGGPSFGERGGGLGVSLELCRAVGRAPKPPPAHLVHGRRRLWVDHREWEEPAHVSVTAYGALWRWLHAQLDEATVQFGRSVAFVEDMDAGVRVTTSDARVERFDVLVAADGGASALRSAVEGSEHPHRYAGYILWRGLVRTRDLDDATHGLQGRFHIANRGNHHFVAYPIPSHTGSTAPEDLLLNWGWYHPLPERALAEVLAASDSAPPHALVSAEAAIRLFAAAEAADGRRWPDWVLHIAGRSRARGAVAPHPVFEFVPRRMAGRHVVLAGDAAHLASPITGSGARMAMEDALALAAALEDAASIPEALSTFASRRRRASAEVVLTGQRRGAAFRADARALS